MQEDRTKLSPQSNKIFFYLQDFTGRLWDINEGRHGGGGDEDDFRADFYLQLKWRLGSSRDLVNSRIGMFTSC